MKSLKRIVLIATIVIASQTANADAHHIDGTGRFGCASKDYFEKLVGFAVDKDVEAFKKGLIAGVVAGQCTTFQNGEEVYLTDTAIFSGLAQVRKKGEMRAYWTNIEAVK